MKFSTLKQLNLIIDIIQLIQHKIYTINKEKYMRQYGSRVLGKQSENMILLEIQEL